MGGRKLYSHEKMVTDRTTGEILSEESTTVHQIPEEPPYVKLYLDDLIKLNDLPKSSSAILYEFVRKMNYDGFIVINASIKRMIGADLGVKEQSISNAISTFVKKDIMHRFDKGVYILNPSLFAKGKWTDVRKLREQYLDLTVRYTKDGKKVLYSNLTNE